MVRSRTSTRRRVSSRRPARSRRRRVPYERIHVASFNISISTQLGKEVGSEADFVRECKRKRIDCFRNGVATFSKLAPLHVLALQEVEIDRAETAFQRTQPSLDRYVRGSVWDEPWKTWAHCSLLWNSRTLGECVWHDTFSTEMGRPCLQIIVEKRQRRVLLVSLSAPHMTKRSERDALERTLSENLRTADVDDLVIMGDFNDHSTLIHSGRPLRVGQHAVSQGMTRQELRRDLVTCCWHEPGHKYPSMTDTGDYVLARDVRHQRVPREFETTRGVAFASDHLPVEATVVLSSER